MKPNSGSKSEGSKAPLASAATPSASTNRATVQPIPLKDYLDYYGSLKEPHYAVLVTGDWGTGKTHQVHEALPATDAYYVSLFGLNSGDDIVAAVYSSMFPRKARAKKLADSVGEVTAEVSGWGSLALNGLTSSLVGAFLRHEVDNQKPIIFDDLERCGLGLKETLGIINLYVEHHGCRVIVIAHDEKLEEYFSEAKEKIFGQTISVQPQVASAFDAFYSELAEGIGKTLVRTQRDNIINVFSESEVQSLRILRHLIEDLARLVDTLSDKHRERDDAMVELIRLFSALDIEWRSNRLKGSDLRNRREAVYASSGNKAEGDTPKIVLAKNRYKLVNITSTLLQDEVLTEMLVKGRFDEASIQGILGCEFLLPEAGKRPSLEDRYELRCAR